MEHNQLSEEGKKRVRRIYRWGFLGLWPGVGAVTGIILLLRGVFQYKDKGLIFIGSGCLLFNIFLFSVFFYDFRSGGGFDKANAIVVHSELNSMVKAIEFYKVQNDTYPDSLE